MHGIGDAFQLLARNGLRVAPFIGSLQNLGKAHDDVERGAYLVCYVLYECCLLLLALHHEFRGLFQFLIVLLLLFAGLLYAVHVVVQRLLHGGKTVL